MYQDILKTLVGFDYHTNSNSYPPYNIVRTEEGYSIEIACAGFEKSELSCNLTGNQLIVKGVKNNPSNTKTYVYRGIALRSWTHRWTLEKSVVPHFIEYKDGVLTIVLKTTSKTTPTVSLEIN